MTTKSEAATTALLTPTFRVSFPNVFKPRAAPGSTEEKYSITMIFPKVITDPKEAEMMAALKAAVTQAAIGKWGPDKTKWPVKKIDLGNGEIRTVSAINSPWHDGAEKDYDGYGKDVIYAAASAKKDYPPKVVDAQVQPIIAPNEFYAGCYARARVTVFAYENKRLGVSFGLRNIQKARDGEPLAGRSDPANDFDAIAAPSGAPKAAAAPTSDPLGV